MPPGHTVEVVAGPAGPQVRLREYWRLSWQPNGARTFEEACDGVIELLLRPCAATWSPTSTSG